jgi:DNA-binding NtrC family response regulator
LERLKHHPWPGNIRQLRNVMERAVLFSGGGPVGPEHLALGSLVTEENVGARRPTSTLVPRVEAPEAPSAPEGLSPCGLREHLHSVERQRIIAALEQCAGNQTRAALLLKLSRRGLIKKLDSLGIPRPRKAGDPRA